VVGYYNQYYPSLSLMLAPGSLNLEPRDIRVNLGEGCSWATRKSPPTLTCRCTLISTRTGWAPAFPVDSFYDVFTGKIPADKYRDKIVLIGASAAGVVRCK